MNKKAYELGVQQALTEKLALDMSAAKELAHTILGPSVKGLGIGAGIGTGAAGLRALLGSAPEDVSLAEFLRRGAITGGVAGLGAGTGSHLGAMGSILGGLLALRPGVELAIGEKLPSNAAVRKMIEAERAGTYTPGDIWQND